MYALQMRANGKWVTLYHNEDWAMVDEQMEARLNMDEFAGFEFRIRFISDLIA